MRILTGIKPTGNIHLGNYIGAIRPIIELSKKAEEVFLFVADYHALNKRISPEELKSFNKEMMIVLHSFLGHLDNVYIYFQSDVPEIFEFATILSNYTTKGLLNRAHAYKTLVDNNLSSNKDSDFEINIGLYNYPLLMSADILTFNPDFVPVGFDQKQHLEITRDIANTFNSVYEQIIKVPNPHIQNETSLLGLDGKKMSKSYNNTIELFLDEQIILKKFKKIKSDSTEIGEPINYEDDILFNIMSSFLEADRLNIVKKMYKNGEKRIDIKMFCFNEFISHFKPFRDRYEEIDSNFDIVSDKINKDLKHVRNVAKRNLKDVKSVVGISL